MGNMNGHIKEVINTLILYFKENESKINNLNVFPVPDGDTGTNMLLTLKSIQQEINNLNSQELKTIADKISFGALMGARGNSGVILSQILKGFFDVIVQKNEISLPVIKEAVKSSMDLAYSSVQNPTEGTILTTIKDIHKTVETFNGNNSVHYMKLLNKIIEETEKSVLRTTFLLPVLKQAGVVDAGAQGLLEILIGLKKALAETGEGKNFSGKNAIVYTGSETVSDGTGNFQEPSPGQSGSRMIELISSIKNIYCTELMIRGDNINIIKLREDIESFGDSALIVGNQQLVKIHVHTNFPQKVLHRAIKEGSLHEIQINNMVDQSRMAANIEISEEMGETGKEIGIIAISNGDGFGEIFKSLGVDVVIKGGQSMNPSTYEIVKEINKIASNHIILLPNNKNIILTANQAKKIVKRNIYVIPSTTIPQGISAALLFNPDLNIDENIMNMTSAIEEINTGEITKAVRDANLYVGEIKKGAFIGLANGKVKVISENMIDCVIDLVRDMAAGSAEVVTFYYGEEANPEDNKIINERLKNCYPDLEIEFHAGGQPLYPYIFSIE
jgi:uncharacterized protein